ncbi:MAG: outer membrane beta-barrel protein [Acidobacteriaceae bacterium]|nr:outer membrane beta-barrel protein [Acidobacteriaceae bacterium]
MKKRTLPSTVALLLAAPFALACSCLPAHAQSVFTAEKGADIFVFGGYTYLKPDYGPDSVHNNGITLGADFTRYFRWPVTPSIEVRYTHASGPVVNEHTFSGGLKVGKTYRTRFHPYADILAGLGGVHYVTPPVPDYPDDTALAITYGGGVDIDVLDNWAVKADFQSQHWNLGKNATIKPDGEDYTLSPLAFTIGVSYRIPFHSRVGSGEHHARAERAQRSKAVPPAPAEPAPAPNTQQNP